MKERYLIDASSLVFRYSFALGEIFSPQGELISGFSGFCKYILKLIKEKQPSQLLIAFDKCKNNFRKEISPIYKSNRKSQPLIYPQIDHAIAFCDFVGIPTDYDQHHEADDFLAAYSQNTDNKVVIVSTDKDLMQLVNEKIMVLNPFQNVFYDREGVYNRMGVYPEQIPLFLAICGDSSDNVPGIKGIGPVGAQKLIKKHSLEELKEVIPQHYDTILEGLSLVRLKTDIPLRHKNLETNFNHEFFHRCSLFLDNYGLKHAI